MTDYVVSFTFEDEVGFSDRISSRSAEEAVKKALEGPVFTARWHNDEIEREDVFTVTTKTTEHKIKVGDVIDEADMARDAIQKEEEDATIPEEVRS